MKSHRQLKQELLKDPATRKAYEDLGPEFAIVRAIIEKRIERGLTQAALARQSRKSIAVPKFRSEKQERAFWAKVDLSRHFSARDFSAVSFPDLKPTSRAISVRLPEHLLMRLKEQANELDIPYQSLLKQHIARGLARKQHRRTARVS